MGLVAAATLRIGAEDWAELVAAFPAGAPVPAGVRAARRRPPRSPRERAVDTAASTAWAIALQRAGRLGHELGDGKRAVLCPWDNEHSTPDGDLSRVTGGTVLYPPDAAGQSLGYPWCNHAHCSGRSLREWIDAVGIEVWTEATREAARAAAPRPAAQVQGPATQAEPAADEPPAPVQVRASFARGDSVELARAVLDDLRGESPVPLVYDRAAFWRYDPATGVYPEVTEGAVYQAVARYAGCPVLTGKEPRPLLLSDNSIKGAVAAARQFAARPGFFNAAPRGVAFANCFVTVERGEVKIHSHCPEHRAQHALPFDYEMGTGTDRWNACLRTLFTPTDEAGVSLPPERPETADADREALIAILQEFAGAVLLGIAPSLQACLILQGPGEDGKSVVLKVLSELVPPEARCSVAPQDWSNQFLLAELAGKRLNVVSELPERDILESERFKAVVTGDPLTAARKFRDPFTLVAEAGQLFACNALPATRDQSYGFWRRPIVLPFAHRFTGAERIRDYHLVILAEELPGIAAWAVEGAARAQARGEYSTAPASLEAKRVWQVDTDQVRQFVEDCARPDPAGDASLVELYAAFAAWARETGHGGMSRNALGSRLRGLGYGARSATGRFYRLALADGWDADGLAAKRKAQVAAREDRRVWQ